jgi:hypothetical protein
MVTGNYQEAEFKNASYKNSKKRKLKVSKRKKIFFVFLLAYLTYLKKKKGIIFVFLEKI